MWVDCARSRSYSRLNLNRCLHFRLNHTMTAAMRKWQLCENAADKLGPKKCMEAQEGESGRCFGGFLGCMIS